jgi:hypothetical protein
MSLRSMRFSAQWRLVVAARAAIVFCGNFSKTPGKMDIQLVESGHDTDGAGDT